MAGVTPAAFKLDGLDPVCQNEACRDTDQRGDLMKILQVIPDAYSVEIQRAGVVKHLSYGDRETALKSAYSVCATSDRAWAIVTPIPGGWLAVEDNARLVLLTNDDLMATIRPEDDDELVTA